MAQISKGSLVKGPYKPICRDCAINFSGTVYLISLSKNLAIRTFVAWTFWVWDTFSRRETHPIWRTITVPKITATYPLKRDCFNRKYIFQPLIFRGEMLVFGGVLYHQLGGGISTMDSWRSCPHGCCYVLCFEGTPSHACTIMYYIYILHLL